MTSFSFWSIMMLALSLFLSSIHAFGYPSPSKNPANHSHVISFCGMFSLAMLKPRLDGCLAPGLSIILLQRLACDPHRNHETVVNTGVKDFSVREDDLREDTSSEIYLSENGVFYVVHKVAEVKPFTMSDFVGGGLTTSKNWLNN